MVMIKTFKLLLVACVAFSAPLQSGAEPDFSVDWYTIDGGGGTSSGGAYSLSGTIGQHDASPAPMQGGAFTLVGGFWSGGIPESDRYFRDGFENL